MAMKHFKNLPIGNLFINHSTNGEVAITVYTSRTALILGNNDENINALRVNLATSFPEYKFTLDVKEVKKLTRDVSSLPEFIAPKKTKK